MNTLEEMVFNSHRASDSKLAEITEKNGLLLIAYHGEDPVGFKLGYATAPDRIFFSWLGGVHKNFRRQGIAQNLLIKQESLVEDMGIRTIYFTSFDRFPAMISLGKKNGYKLVRKEIDKAEMKYWYEKHLY